MSTDALSPFESKDWQRLLVGLIFVALIDAGTLALWNIDREHHIPTAEFFCLGTLLLLPAISCFLFFRRLRGWLFPMSAVLTWAVGILILWANDSMHLIDVEELGYSLLPLELMAIPVVTTWSLAAAITLLIRKNHFSIAVIDLLIGIAGALIMLPVIPFLRN